MEAKNVVLAVGIPTINRADLLAECLEDLTKQGFDVLVVDNGNQGISHPNIVVNEQNKGVAGSWNQLIRTLRANNPALTHVVLLNDDIVWGKSVDQVKSILAEHGTNTLVTSDFFWSVICIPLELYDSVGEFDENFFPAYFEDNDYAYRVKLTNGEFKHVSTAELNPVVMRNSMTIDKDQSLNKNFEANAQYFFRKWGGEPTKERYLHPFNINQTAILMQKEQIKGLSDCPVPILQDEREWMDFMNYVSSEEKIKKIVEIGSFFGGSLWFYTKFLNPEVIVSVDMPIPPEDSRYQQMVDSRGQWESWMKEISFIEFTGNSHDKNISNALNTHFPESDIDMLFIDGDHSYDGVKLDFLDYKGLVRSGGIIVFHDINGRIPDVERFWNEVIEFHSDEFEFVKRFDNTVEENHGWGIGIIRKR